MEFVFPQLIYKAFGMLRGFGLLGTGRILLVEYLSQRLCINLRQETYKSGRILHCAFYLSELELAFIKR